MKYIAYYRVSTKKQGESQLGLKAQKHSVEKFIAPELIDKEFVEIETGTKKKYRPILNEAIELCKKHDSTLIIAKLDRLARNVSFVSSLMDSGIKFKAVDMPEANELTIHIMSAIAQHEAKAISTRVKEGLAQSKKKLGTPANLTLEARMRGLESVRNKAKENPHNKRALAFVRGLKYQDMKLREIAESLNNNGFQTSKGKEFGTTQVIRILNKV
jgi:DNA invertase Pin-like site-specific DNA recombinase|tara:strand:- start:124 stop:768 length:645 start_codon:yes stop_codon:yes gene_type:complete